LSPELAELRLTGIISGTRPMAVLRQGDRRYFLRSGDALPGGWRIVQIEARGVTVAKGNERVQLRVSKGGAGA